MLLEDYDKVRWLLKQDSIKQIGGVVEDQCSKKTIFYTGKYKL